MEITEDGPTIDLDKALISKNNNVSQPSSRTVESRVIRFFGRENNKNPDQILNRLKEQSLEFLRGLDNHQVSIEAIKAMQSLMSVLQMDTVQEFYFAADANKKIGHRDVNLKSAGNEGRAVVFLLLSNLFNSQDEKIETALSKMQMGKSSASRILTGVLDKGLAGVIQQESKVIRISPKQMLTYIRDFGEYQGCDMDTFDRRIDLIIKAHERGLELLHSNYTVDEAVSYRIATVGTYHRLLSEIMFDQQTKRDKYIKTAMLVQFSDDMLDVELDIHTQPNPFVPLRNGLNVRKFLRSVRGALWQLIVPKPIIENAPELFLDKNTQLYAERILDQYLICSPEQAEQFLT